MAQCENEELIYDCEEFPKSYIENSNEDDDYIFPIVGHPVMIGDCLDWNDKQQTWLDGKDKADWRMVNSHLCMLWEYKRLPIDEQSDECIDYIYSLIK